MTFNWKLILFVVMTLLLAIAIFIASHYSLALTESKASLTKVNRELNLAKDTITDMQARQRDVAALDEKFTKELADAKATIDQLHDDVATGKRRLQLNATCSKQSAPGAASMADAASPGLTDSAERDYFTLRERIATVIKQLTGLQAYVREQCLK
ncbi:lysis protein [Cronobacter sakazakii]|uniref:lysis protein n=1 Tax=Cronobacter sakazakii TaxID=28141 RepID=UPI000CFBB84F|nr:lysis protein [Cronobacter sakazakii]PQX84121.1 lysis protein [Cronobacter sakazakii]PQY01708.1 lysis protein [Cronobacter sakazakii]PQY37159.1 lysis protein [Cronobacter sakazakii]PQY56373.1 lysis protein [Cronobacter sakazakii]